MESTTSPGARPLRVEGRWMYYAIPMWHWTSPTMHTPPAGVRGTHFHPEGRVYDRTIETWDLDPDEARLVLNINLDPADASYLAEATDLLVHYIRSDKIADVVRKPVPRLGGLTLLDVLSSGNTKNLLRVCQDMFRFEDASF